MSMIRRSMMIGVAGLIPAVFVAAFLTMASIRARQRHSGIVPESKIEGLAVHTGPVDPSVEARTRGEQVYRHYCQVCHGEKGKGDGRNAGLLKTPPRDFTNREFWEKQTTKERVHDAVAKGGTVNGKSVLMPAWGKTLTESEIRDVIIFIRDFPAKPKAQGE